MKLPMTKNEDGEYKELLSICRVSSNHDENIAQIVSKAIQISGLVGTVEIEESPNGITTLEVVDGLFLSRGIASEDLFHKEDENEVEMQYPLILLLEDKLKDTK